MIGAGATLGGAALGAWLGAKGAYKSTVRANTEALRREKLEEALHITFEVVAKLRIIRTVFESLPIGVSFNAGRDKRLIKAVNDLDSDSIVKLNDLLRIYDSKIYENLFDLLEKMLLSLISLDKEGFTECERKNVLQDMRFFEEKATDIEQALLNKLQL